MDPGQNSLPSHLLMCLARDGRRVRLSTGSQKHLMWVTLPDPWGGDGGSHQAAVLG